MSFQRDPLGEMLPLGRVRKRRTFDVWPDTAALPSWLTATGTLTFPGGGGVAKVTSGASIGATCGLAGPAIDLAQFTAVLFTVEGVSFDTTTGFDVELDMLGATGVGCQFKQGSTGDAAALKTQGTTVSQTSSYAIRDVGRRNLTLAICPPSGHVAVMCDDQYVSYVAQPSWTDGPVTPQLLLTAQASAAAGASVARVELTVFHD